MTPFVPSKRLRPTPVFPEETRRLLALLADLRERSADATRRLERALLEPLQMVEAALRESVRVDQEANSAQALARQVNDALARGAATSSKSPLREAARLLDLVETLTDRAWVHLWACPKPPLGRRLLRRPPSRPRQG